MAAEAANRAQIFYARDLSKLDGANGFRLDGVRAGQKLGIGLSAGDFDGDGLSDIAASAPWRNTERDKRPGSVFVLFGAEAEDPSPEGGALTLSVVDVRTSKALATLTDGAVLSATVLGNTRATLSAEIAPDSDLYGRAGSVEISLDGPVSASRIERVAPYTLFGDNSWFGPFGGARMQPGDYVAKIAAYAGRDGDGALLHAETFAFTVIPPSIEIMLVDTRSDAALFAFSAGDTLRYADYADLEVGLAVRATEGGLLDGIVGSMALSLRRHGTQAAALGARVENVEPYALFGDDPATGDFHRGTQNLWSGAYTLSVEAYAERFGRGEVLETAEIDFWVV